MDLWFVYWFSTLSKTCLIICLLSSVLHLKYLVRLVRRKKLWPLLEKNISVCMCVCVFRGMLILWSIKICVSVLVMLQTTECKYFQVETEWIKQQLAWLRNQQNADCSIEALVVNDFIMIWRKCSTVWANL